MQETEDALWNTLTQEEQSVFTMLAGAGDSRYEPTEVAKHLEISVDHVYTLLESGSRKLRR